MEFFTKNNDCRFSPTLRLLAALIEDNAEKPQFFRNCGDRGRIAGGAEDPHRTRLPGCFQKVAEGCIRAEEDCIEGPKSVVEQMAAPVPNIMHGSL
jgi:hypothetical protein